MAMSSPLLAGRSPRSEEPLEPAVWDRGYGQGQASRAGSGLVLGQVLNKCIVKEEGGKSEGEWVRRGRVGHILEWGGPTDVTSTATNSTNSMSPGWFCRESSRDAAAAAASSSPPHLALSPSQSARARPGTCRAYAVPRRAAPCSASFRRGSGIEICGLIRVVCVCACVSRVFVRKVKGCGVTTCI
jgi:hypothetical protein